MRCSISPLWTRGTGVLPWVWGLSLLHLGLLLPLVPIAGELALAISRSGLEGTLVLRLASLP